MMNSGNPAEYNPVIRCRACGKRHGKRHLCDPLMGIVEAMMDAAEKNDTPITEFMEAKPIAGAAGMLGPGTVLCRQLLVYGAVVPFRIAGKPAVTNPALVFTGEDADGKKLPQWVFAGSTYELRALRDVVDRMTEMAIRRAE